MYSELFFFLSNLFLNKQKNSPIVRYTFFSFFLLQLPGCFQQPNKKNSEKFQTFEWKMYLFNFWHFKTPPRLLNMLIFTDKHSLLISAYEHFFVVLSRLFWGPFWPVNKFRTSFFWKAFQLPFVAECYHEWGYIKNYLFWYNHFLVHSFFNSWSVERKNLCFIKWN